MNLPFPLPSTPLPSSRPPPFLPIFGIGMMLLCSQEEEHMYYPSFLEMAKVSNHAHTQQFNRVYPCIIQLCAAIICFYILMDAVVRDRAANVLRISVERLVRLCEHVRSVRDVVHLLGGC